MGTAGGRSASPTTRVADGQTRDRRGSATPVHVEAENLGTAYVRRRSTLLPLTRARRKFRDIHRAESCAGVPQRAPDLPLSSAGVSSG
ncbi:hypothetical protein F3K40_45380 [Streptomyces sp. LBUM 1478]|nr:hypothetical protein [Streptomyces sp. LBUM 1478]